MGALQCPMGGADRPHRSVLCGGRTEGWGDESTENVEAGEGSGADVGDSLSAGSVEVAAGTGKTILTKGSCHG